MGYEQDYSGMVGWGGSNTRLNSTILYQHIYPGFLGIQACLSFFNQCKTFFMRHDNLGNSYLLKIRLMNYLNKLRKLAATDYYSQKKNQV